MAYNLNQVPDAPMTLSMLPAAAVVMADWVLVLNVGVRKLTPHIICGQHHLIKATTRGGQVVHLFMTIINRLRLVPLCLFMIKKKTRPMIGAGAA